MHGPNMIIYVTAGSIDNDLHFFAVVEFAFTMVVEVISWMKWDRKGSICFVGSFTIGPPLVRKNKVVRGFENVVLPIFLTGVNYCFN